MSDDEGEEGTSTDIGYTRPATTRVVKVGYCGGMWPGFPSPCNACSLPLPCAARAVSGLPFEYCEFVPEFPKCKEWFQQNYQSFYPEVSEEAELTELMTRLGFEGEPDANAKKAQSSKKKPTEAAEGAEEGGAEGAPAAAEGEGGGGKKKKKEAKKELLIEMTSRNKKKHVTTITGLQLFGVDEAAAAKVFGKKVRSTRHGQASTTHAHPIRYRARAVCMRLGVSKGQERAARPDRDPG